MDETNKGRISLQHWLLACVISLLLLAWSSSALANSNESTTKTAPKLLSDGSLIHFKGHFKEGKVVIEGAPFKLSGEGPKKKRKYVVVKKEFFGRSLVFHTAGRGSSLFDIVRKIKKENKAGIEIKINIMGIVVKSNKSNYMIITDYDLEYGVKGSSSLSVQQPIKYTIKSDLYVIENKELYAKKHEDLKEKYMVKPLKGKLKGLDLILLPNDNLHKLIKKNSKKPDKPVKIQGELFRDGALNYFLIEKYW